MNAVLIIVGVAVILIVTALLVRAGRWNTVLVAPGSQAEDVQNKYAYLHGRGIRSRVREEDGQPTSGIAAGMMQAGGNHSAVKLQVHKDDVEKAKDALDDYTRERLTSHSPIL